MHDLLSLLPSGRNCVRIQRSGAATICRFASDIVSHGRSCVILARNMEEFVKYRSLLPLFSRESDERLQDDSIPRWENSVQILSPFVQRGNREVIAQNLASFYALQKGRTFCLLLSMEALLLRHIPLDFFTSRSFSLAAGHDYSPELIMEQVIAWGYKRVPMVVETGEVAMRGDILDIFPAGYEKPLRMEFFGDTIEEIRVFDPENQRSRKNVSHIEIIPTSVNALSVAEREDAAKHFDGLASDRKISENTAYTLKKSLATEGEKLLAGHLFRNATTIENWLNKDVVWFIREENDVVRDMQIAYDDLAALSEGSEPKILPPLSLVLRSPKTSPCEAFSRVSFADQVFGDVREGEELLERSISSFEALFPSKQAQDRPWQTLMSALKEWRSQYRQVLLSFTSPRGRTKFIRLAEQDGVVANLAYDSRAGGLYALIAPFRKGCEMVWDGCLILGEEIIFPRAIKGVSLPQGKFRGLHSIDGIKEGDLLVHRDYGIGRFGGLHHLTLNKYANDFILIEYAGHDKLYVSADNLALIQRYKGKDSGEPTLDRLGGTGWKHSREKARKSIEQIASDLVEMYAYRKVVKGFQYGPLTEEFREFEATFDYEETPDQAQAIQDVLNDMSREMPMDRLVCGDVGFGKTEVALRAAFRAASEGRQVALLCPTTVLAEQHYQTFRSRLGDFGITVGLLSRFVPRAKQESIIAEAAKGTLDVLIGTHRILSDDVSLPNLGLMILDEEQRFGVRHKEKMKGMKKNIDVLTLTATPIPRTLQLSMSGIRDLSLIETPPENRKPIETYVVNRDPVLLKTVLERELARRGQVFWVYNRVRGLAACTDFVKKLIPDARVASAHGKMNENSLEEIMYKFWHGEIDVLVCTSIVESGLDFPNVNTIIVDQAQMFGLGQLYQLRGRVGRSERQAYAYLVVPEKTSLSQIAEERLRILQEMDYLGAGFQLAAEDLRMRGAGNILGEVQSGDIGRVGLDLYLEMLENTIARLKGLPEVNLNETELSLGVPAHIPVSYMDDNHERMHFYKALTSARSPKEREDIVLEIRDRFGPLPEEASNFVAIMNLKQILTNLQVGKAEVCIDHVQITWVQGQKAVQPERVLALVHTVEGARVVPPASVYFPLNTKETFEKEVDALRHNLAGLTEKNPEAGGTL